MTAKKTKPLSGVRVLDLGRALSAPTVGVQLADFGAEVIKIESSSNPDQLSQGDWIRAYGVIYGAANRDKKVSAYT